MAILSDAQKSTQKVKVNKETEEYVPKKKQNKTSGEKILKMEISELSNEV